MGGVGMLTGDALEAQLELMDWRRGERTPLAATTIDGWVLRELARDLDDQVEALVASGPFLPDDFHVVLRADGGLWLTACHHGLCTIFDVPAVAWMPSRARSAP